MADNVQHPTTGTGTADVVQKTDDLSGAHVPYVKVLDGTNGGTEPIAGTTANGLDVDVTRVQGTVATGSANGTPVTATWDDTTPSDTTLDIPATGYNAILVQLDDSGGASEGLISFQSSLDGGTIWRPIVGTNLGDTPTGLRVSQLNIAAFGGFEYWILFPMNGMTHLRLQLGTPIVGATVVSIHAVPTSTTIDTTNVLHTTGEVGDPVPGYGLVVAGSDAGGLLRDLKTDTDGHPQVDVLTLPSLSSGSNDIGNVVVTAIMSGANNIGRVDIDTIASVPADPFGVNADAAVAAGAAGSVSAKLRRATQGLEDLKTGVILAAGTNNIGDVDVLTVPAPLNVVGAGTEAAAQRVTLANDSTGVLSVDDNGSTLSVDDGGGVLTVDGTVGVSGTVTTAAAGDVAHDTADSGNPLKLGGVAVSGSASPTSVAAGDRTRAIFNQHGIPYTIAGHPNLITREYDFGVTGQTDVNLAAAAVAADERVYVTRFEATCDAANTVAVAVRAGFGAANVPTASATGVSGMIASHPGIAAGSGIICGAGAGIIAVGAAGEEPRLTSSAATDGNLHVIISYFLIDETP